LAGGNWARGRRIFFGQQAACSRCHKYGGQGEFVGPDLSNLPHRDYASVLRDIEQPSFAINPDHLAHTVQLDDGRVLTGILRHRNDQTQLIDMQGNVTIIADGTIEATSPSTKSIMPEGLPKLLGEDQMRDLLTFLLTPLPSMPLDGTVPPFIRTRAEVEKVLAGSAPPAASLKQLRLVLVSGPKDHGPGEHDYPRWRETWAQLLALGEATIVSTASDWPSADDFRTADVIVFYQQGKWSPQRAADIDAYLARGGGLVYIHYAVDGGADPVGMAERIGLAWRGNQSRFRHGPLDLEFRNTTHPITRNFSHVHFHDESYWQLVGNPERINLLASGEEEGAAQPLFWTAEPGKGRVFVSILGHYSWTFDDPLFRVLLLRGTVWAAGEPVDRWNELVFPGARIGP
jgi:putative heme-binding domain-containing protein